MEENRELTTRDISEIFKQEEVDISSYTVIRRLIEAGMAFKSPSSKSFLSNFQKANRLDFGRQNKNRNWNNVLFTEETTIKLPRNKSVWKRRGENIVVRRFKHYQKIHVWGSFSKFGFGRIYS